MRSVVIARGVDLHGQWCHVHCLIASVRASTRYKPCRHEALQGVCTAKASEPLLTASLHGLIVK
jgi:hypothetical protein